MQFLYLCAYFKIMKKNILLISFILFSFITIHAQNNNVWYSIYDDNNLMGFVDENGKVKIEPKFDLIGHKIWKFDQIIAIKEQIDDSLHMYYLLKDGTKITKYDMYVDERYFQLPCESEGLIIFQDKEKDLLGMLNAKGEIQIPAEYNNIFPFHNGYAFALTNSHKRFWTQTGEKDEHDGCNHWHWEGGKFILINTKNEIIIDSLPESSLNIDLYSIQKSKSPSKEKNYQSFKGKDGYYYSFLDYDKAFESFFYDTFIKDSKNEKYYYSIVTTWNLDGSEIGYRDNNRIEIFHKLFSHKINLSDIDRNGKNISFNSDVTFLYHEDDEKYFLEFFDNCYSLNYYKYPAFRVFVSDSEGELLVNVTFLKTKNGFQIVDFY